MFGEPTEYPFSPERLQALADEMEKKLEKLGCYVRNTAFEWPRDEEGNFRGDPFFIVDCQIGTVAWSPRIQDPVQDEMNDEFRGIAADEAEQAFEEIRRKEQERRAREALDDPDAESKD